MYVQHGLLCKDSDFKMLINSSNILKIFIILHYIFLVETMSIILSKVYILLGLETWLIIWMN